MVVTTRGPSQTEYEVMRRSITFDLPVFDDLQKGEADTSDGCIVVLNCSFASRRMSRVTLKLLKAPSGHYMRDSLGECDIYDALSRCTQRKVTVSRLVDVHDDERHTPRSADHEVLLLRCRHPQEASGPTFEVVAAEVRPLDEEAHCEHVPFWDKTGSLFHIPRFRDADDVAASEQSTRFVGSITIQELEQGMTEARRPAIEAKLAIQSFCNFVDSTRVEFDSAVFFEPNQLGIQYYPTVFFGAILEGIAVFSDGKILVASHETKSLLGKPWRAIEFKIIRKTDLIVELARALMLFTFITLSFAIIWLPSAPWAAVLDNT